LPPRRSFFQIKKLFGITFKVIGTVSLHESDDGNLPALFLG
jgi:hypothetical protein